MSPRRFFGPLLGALGLFAACSAPPRSSEQLDQTACDECEPSNDAPGRPGDGVSQNGDERERPNELCRSTSSCDLDSSAACTPATDQAGGAGAGGAAGQAGGGGAGQPAGAGGEAGAGEAGAGGLLRAAPAAGAGGEAGAGGSGEAGYACRMVRSASDGVIKCEPAGSGGHFASCSSSSNCQPGYSCVLGPFGLPVCLHSCCSASACGQVTEEKTYCAVLSLVEGETSDASGQAPLPIPVCVPVKPCDVLKAAGGGACAEGEICRLVDDKGTATCERTFGNAPAYNGQGCSALRPCAEGYVCLQDSNTCRKLCPLGDDAACGERGTCLSGGLAFPAGVGVCGPDSVAPP
ncbi:MAG TPA: hypothetical protein VFS43_37430 [Polyangiaceae bacterium]|nr:hypothetical protein [Polyangiaceae bacterium]